jgi:hypothetical protein
LFLRFFVVFLAFFVGVVDVAFNWGFCKNRVCKRGELGAKTWWFAGGVWTSSGQKIGG